ncbi:hypothetical protein [Nostoc sp. TCL26-01]|uniref:hypothetical protein n=1 Tax=Nostoc sp. TCL26-01 TaxID=2576904 RepID=UPI0015BD1FE8|nr:hypothetical protein [Nostoc sp. TCL26-01]QLE56822.1 hypothetical protein FD725_15675 [Nostoc sp. TCL26-01]
MKQSKNFYRLGLTFLLVVELYGCTPLKMSDLREGNIVFGRNVTPIRDIKPVPDKSVTVYVQGKVEKEVPLIKGWVYQINDSTSTIWVVTHQRNLKNGDSVVIKGKVLYESIPIAGEEFGEVYLVEE